LHSACFPQLYPSLLQREGAPLDTGFLRPVSNRLRVAQVVLIVRDPLNSAAEQTQLHVPFCGVQRLEVLCLPAMAAPKRSAPCAESKWHHSNSTHERW